MRSVASGERVGGPRTRLASLLAIVFLLSLLPAATPAAAAGDPKPNDALDSAVAFRAKVGFRADRAFVAASLTDRSFKRDRWGVPLDAGEAAELQRRLDGQKALGKALRKAAKDTHSAGAYIDQAAGGVPVFLTT